MLVMYLHGVYLYNRILSNYLSCLKNVHFSQLPEGFIKLHDVSKLNFSFSPRKCSKIDGKMLDASKGFSQIL